MNVFCLGINHRTAPIEIREKMWFASEEIRPILAALNEQHTKECALISTCNRTELYYVPNERGTNGEPFWKILARHKNANSAVNEKHFYTLNGSDAVRQAFSVAAGIDSMVLGDVQILNQMKEAFAIGQEMRTTGIILNRLFTASLHTGKRARTETEIGEGAVSISYAAAELASKIFEDLSKRTAFLIGAGETGELTARHLTGRNLGTLLVANRTRERAEELVSRLGGRVIDFENLRNNLPNVDIIISSVNAPSHVLSANDIRTAMKQRSNKPLFVIDIGVPRNIDPTAKTISNVFLNDIDALNHIVDSNLARRQAEVPKIQEIIADELAQFKIWYDSLEVTPTIQQLREQFEAIRQLEVEKHLHHFPSNKHDIVDMLTKRIINKILHEPMVNLHNGTGEHHDHETRTQVHLIRHLFGLDKKSEK